MHTCRCCWSIKNSIQHQDAISDNNFRYIIAQHTTCACISISIYAPVVVDSFPPISIFTYCYTHVTLRQETLINYRLQNYRALGFAGWFTVDFNGSVLTPATRRVTLSTGPEAGYTHWGQQVRPNTSSCRIRVMSKS